MKPHEINIFSPLLNVGNGAARAILALIKTEYGYSHDQSYLIVELLSEDEF